MNVSRQSRGGFSLLELLVTMAVLSIFVVLLFAVTDSSFRLWRQTHSSIAMFDEARAAYDTLSRRLSQATLNTYLDYYSAAWQRRPSAAVNPSGAAAFIPARYARASDLHFLSGPAGTILGSTSSPTHGVFFFAPLGLTGSDPALADLNNLLNACGYYLEWGSDAGFRPGFLSSLPDRYRVRLIENIQRSQNFVDYPSFTDVDGTNDRDWITVGLKTDSDPHVLAENIIALIIRPEMPEQDAVQVFGPSGKPWTLTTDYGYDSLAGATRPTITVANPTALQFAQLPPMLRVVMVAVDEKSAARVVTSSSLPEVLRGNTDKSGSQLFTVPAELNNDLDKLAAKLTDAGVQFRIFNQVIALRGAKFSAQKEN